MLRTLQITAAAAVLGLVAACGSSGNSGGHGGGAGAVVADVDRAGHAPREHARGDGAERGGGEGEAEADGQAHRVSGAVHGDSTVRRGMSYLDSTASGRKS
mgnify:CR=1 FL=1